MHFEIKNIGLNYFNALLKCLFIMVFFVNSAKGQTLLKPTIQDKPLTKLLKPNANISFKQSVQPLAPNFYTRGFGFFCRQELKLQKANIPVNFRLGSKAACDKLEGKNKNNDINAY